MRDAGALRAEYAAGAALNNVLNCSGVAGFSPCVSIAMPRMADPFTHIQTHASADTTAI